MSYSYYRPRHIMLRPVLPERIAYAAAASLPTAHCNKSHDHADLVEKLRLSRKLRRALQRLS